MRIVAGGAGQPVAAGAPAGALQQRFVLRAGAPVGADLSLVNEVADAIEKVLPGSEGGQRATGAVDRSLAFEMTLQTH